MLDAVLRAHTALEKEVLELQKEYSDLKQALGEDDGDRDCQGWSHGLRPPGGSGDAQQGKREEPHHRQHLVISDSWLQLLVWG